MTKEDIISYVKAVCYTKNKNPGKDSLKQSIDYLYSQDKQKLEIEKYHHAW